jgi:hypothetical protein
MIKESTQTMSSVNDEWHQFIPSKASGMEQWAVLKYLETMLKVIMEKLVLTIHLIKFTGGLFREGS